MCITYLQVQILWGMEFMHSVSQLVTTKLRKTINSSLTTEFSLCYLK